MKIVERRIYNKDGVEGPKYDPYGWVEYTLLVNGKRFVYHLGLAEWIRLPNNKRIDMTIKRNGKIIDKIFEKLTGLNFLGLEKAWERIHNPKKCKKCGSKKRKWMNGFPGETLEVCGKCDRIIYSHFDESAIM